jgi:hypothetical protein
MFRDPVQLVTDHYRALTAVQVGTRVPNDESFPNGRPRLFIRVRRTGGPALSRVLDGPIITTEVWGSEAGDEGDCAELANMLRDYLLGTNGTVAPVRRVEEISGPYYDPDPDTGVPRYSFSSRLFIRARI